MRESFLWTGVMGSPHRSQEYSSDFAASFDAEDVFPGGAVEDAGVRTSFVAGDGEITSFLGAGFFTAGGAGLSFFTAGRLSFSIGVEATGGTDGGVAGETAGAALPLLPEREAGSVRTTISLWGEGGIGEGISFPTGGTVDVGIASGGVAGSEGGRPGMPPGSVATPSSTSRATGVTP